MSSESSVNSNNVRRGNNNNNGGGGEAVTRAEFNQLQENIILVMERLEVRDRRSHSGAGSRRRHSSNESDAASARNRRHDGRDDRRHGIENIKLKIPPFTGSSKPEEFLDWVPRLEKVFECYEWDKRMKVKMASLAFSDYASLW